MFKVKTNRGDHLQIHLKVTIQISQRLQADLKKIKKIKIRRSRIILRTMIMIRNSLQQKKKKKKHKNKDEDPDKDKEGEVKKLKKH